MFAHEAIHVDVVHFSDDPRALELEAEELTGEMYLSRRLYQEGATVSTSLHIPTALSAIVPDTADQHIHRYR